LSSASSVKVRLQGFSSKGVRARWKGVLPVADGFTVVLLWLVDVGEPYFQPCHHYADEISSIADVNLQNSLAIILFWDTYPTG
jgi:hypothetical protein